MVVWNILKKIYDLLVSWGLVKASNKAFGAYSVGTTAIQVAAARSTRTAVIIVNNSTLIVYIGDSGVTSVNGIPLDPKDVYENQNWTGALYAIVAAGTANVRVQDFY